MLMTKQRIRIKVRDTAYDEISEKYFEWLCRIVGVGTPRRGHKALARILHAKEFTWFIPNDDNRAADGRELREQFANENLDMDCVCLDGPCSIFEMLIGVAIRMDFILGQSDNVDRKEKWFWEMITNLDLERFSDRELRSNYVRQVVDTTLDLLLSRRYLATGKGGLFPLSRPQRDQRKVEIWYQLMFYLDENYDV